MKKRKKFYAQITEIYHKYNGVPGYRMIKKLLEKQGIFISNLTVHKYMNIDLKLFSVVRRKKPGYKKGVANKIFLNLLKQKFNASKPNEI
ncbi:MAG: transposase, partial [Clostridiales bacterium]|nr:transposase [Clostridiales bacterium]